MFAASHANQTHVYSSASSNREQHQRIGIATPLINGFRERAKGKLERAYPFTVPSARIATWGDYPPPSDRQSIILRRLPVHTNSGGLLSSPPARQVGQCRDTSNTDSRCEGPFQFQRAFGDRRFSGADALSWQLSTPSRIVLDGV
jgi:hypothetical protein